MAEFTERLLTDEYEVLTDSGWSDIRGVGKTIEYEIYKIQTTNTCLHCADNHILFNEVFGEVFAKDLEIGDLIQTDDGLEPVTSIERTGQSASMFDLILDNNSNHRYYTNGLLSHNSTMYTIFALHYCMFNSDKKVLMVANKESTVKELLQRIKMSVTMLPDFLKLGVTKWSAKSIAFENGSSISVSATSPDAARGSSCDVCLTGDTWITVNDHGIIKPMPIMAMPTTRVIDNRSNPAIEQFNIRPIAVGNQDDTELLVSLLNSDRYNKRRQYDYHIKLGVYSIPHCPVCGKKLTDRFNGTHYYATCSKGCTAKLKAYPGSTDNNTCTILTNKGFENYFGLSISNTGQLVKLTTTDGEIIKATPEHKFFLADNNTLILAKDILPGQVLQGLGNRSITIAEAQLIDCGDTSVYDIVNAGSEHSFISNGLLSHNCILDEAAFIPNNIMDEFVASVFPTISSKPEGKIIAVSTPNGIGNWYERTYNKALYNINNNNTDDLQWAQVTFPWYEHPERDEKWKRRQLAMLGGDIKKFTQEFCCEFLGSSNTLFDSKVLEHYKRYHSTNIIQKREENLYGNIVSIFEDAKLNHAYILGVDIADGSGADSSVIHIFDVSNIRAIKQVASFSSKTIGINALALLAARLGARYNNALIAGERNGVGAGFFDSLTNILEYDNILNYKSKDEPAEKQGIYSTNTNKLNACIWAKTLLALAIDQPNTISVEINDNQTCLEMEYFISKTLNTTVSYSASKNNHDDHVMCFIWSLFPLMMDIADNYFTVKGTTFTSIGVELPTIMAPITNSAYTEKFVIEKVDSKTDSQSDYQNKINDAEAREMLQDEIYNAVMGNDEEDTW